MDEGGNIQFNNQFLEEVTPSGSADTSTQNDALVKILEQLLNIPYKIKNN